MVHSLMSGIFPALLLVASRRKGELVPGVSYRALGHPLVIGGIYMLFLSNLFLHGLVIWEHPLQRAGGVLVGLLMLAVTRRDDPPRRFRPARRGRATAGSRRRADGRSWRSWQVATRRTRRFRLRDDDGERPFQSSTGDLPDFATLRSVAIDVRAGRSQGAEGVDAYHLARGSL